MSDDDMIRRGDIGPRLAEAGFGGELLQAAIRTLPARGVGVKPLVWQPTIDGAGNPHTVTVAYCPVFEKRFYAEGPEDQARIDDKRAARIRAALETFPLTPTAVDASKNANTAVKDCALAPTDAAHVNETPKSEHDAGNVLTAAQAREAALREAAAAWEAFKAATTSADHFAAVDRLDAALIGEART